MWEVKVVGGGLILEELVLLECVILLAPSKT